LRSGIVDLAVEVSAHPAEEDERNGDQGNGDGEGEDFGFPTVVEEMVEENEGGPEQADEAYQGADRHQNGTKNRAFTLAGKPLGTMGEPGHRLISATQK